MERITWDSFLVNFRWRQGEHLAAIAPTGGGKTTLFFHLFPKRRYNIFFGTKIDDKLYRKIIRQGFSRIESIEEIRPWEDNVILWPHPAKTIDATYELQEQVFREALDRLAREGAWTLWLDECKYVAEHLHLVKQLTYCLEQFRSIHGTIVSGAQRPVWLPRSVLSNATHVFVWRSNDRDDARRLADIGGIDAREVARGAKTLRPHEFIYVNGRTGEMVKSMVNINKGRGG